MYALGFTTYIIPIAGRGFARPRGKMQPNASPGRFLTDCSLVQTWSPTRSDFGYAVAPNDPLHKRQILVLEKSYCLPAKGHCLDLGLLVCLADLKLP